MKPAILAAPLLCIGVFGQVISSTAGRAGFPTQDLTGRASVEGSVIDAVTQEPVKKATVTLSGRPSLNAVTDALGHFAFLQLPAGRYNVQARGEKYPPAPGGFDAGQQVFFSLDAEEQKRDIHLSLVPGTSVRGQIVDEDGNPMPRCNVAAIQFRNDGVGRALQRSGASQSDDKGEYVIGNLRPGKYYMRAQCYQSLPLPHAFVLRTSIRDVPALTYVPLFYPGATEPSGAARVDAPAGGNVSGIDFRMAPAVGVTVRGRVGPVTDRNMQVTLALRDPVFRDLRNYGSPVNASTGEFQIRSVPPGSYDLRAVALIDGRYFFAKLPVDVGAAPLDPIDVTLAAAPEISGSISIEGAGKMPLNIAHVRMAPLDRQPMQPPAAQVQSDGTFVLGSIIPGRWRLFLEGVPGYTKSVRLGDQDVSAWDFETGPSAIQMKVVAGTKFAQLDASLSSPADGNEQVSGVMWRANGDPGFQQNFGLNAQSGTTIRVPPGRYYACAFVAAQPWMLMQNVAMRKALEGVCEIVDAREDEHTQVKIPVIPAADLKQIVEKIEQ